MVWLNAVIFHSELARWKSGGGVGQSLSISLHYMAQREVQGGGCVSSP
jgi:hypothetical protein